MHKVHLPILASSTPLAVAVAALKESDRGAVISKDGEKYQLFSAAKIVIGLASGAGSIGDLNTGMDIPVELSSPSTARIFVHANMALKYNSGPKTCYCTGPAEHEFPPPQVTVGGQCPYCGSQIMCI